MAGVTTDATQQHSAETFRPGSGRWLVIGFALIAVFAATDAVFTDGLTAIITVWPWLAILVGGCWAIFWRPCVEVSDDQVRLVNVWHTVAVPWGALLGLDTKWALTLTTPKGTHRAWAAPAPGRTTMRHGSTDAKRVRDAAIAGQIRPGDLPSADSGAAAVMVRTAWNERRIAGDLDDVDPHGLAVETRVHWLQIALTVALVAAAIAGVRV